MKRAEVKPLPYELAFERMMARLEEAMGVAGGTRRITEFPTWVQRVMMLLKEQLVPPQFTSIITQKLDVFQEGFLTATMGLVRDIAQHPVSSERRFTRRMMSHLAKTQKSERIAAQMASGAILKSRKFEKLVLNRLFARNPAERRAFVEGLALGSRMIELFEQHANRSKTDATEIYMVLWLFWPDVEKLGSVGAVGRSMGLVFASNPNLARTWDERFRKIANRIRLSFASRQNGLRSTSSDENSTSARAA